MTTPRRPKITVVRESPGSAPKGVDLPPISPSNPTPSKAADPKQTVTIRFARSPQPTPEPTVLPPIASATAANAGFTPTRPQAPQPGQEGGRRATITIPGGRAARMQELAAGMASKLEQNPAKTNTVGANRVNMYVRPSFLQRKVIKHGTQAVLESGFATPFAAALVEKTKEIQCSIALRAGQAPNIDAPSEVSPKPMAVKTKTSSDEQGLPIVAGWIPVDQATFGRSGSKDVPPNFGGTTPEEDGSKNAFHLQTSLRSILADAKAGKYDVVKENNFLVFKSKLPDKTNYNDYDKEHGKGLIDKNQITFRINLAEEFKPAVISLEKAKELRPEVDRDPGDMLAKLGISDAELEKYDKQAFSIDYKLPGKENFNPLLVAAQNGKPITGDADKLWVAPPIDIVRKCKQMANVNYNAGDPSQLKVLIKNYIELKSVYLMRKLTKDEVKNEYDKIYQYAKTAGIITPFELLSNKIINDEFIKSMPYQAFLLQHGPETNNPGDPSDLDGKMFHVHNGQTYLTESEDELVSFVLNKEINYIQDKFVMVHPGWKMEKWAPVIEEQIKLGQDDLMNPKTLENYIQHKKEMNPDFPDTIDEVKNYLQTQKSDNYQVERRGSVIPESLVRASDKYRENASEQMQKVILHLDPSDRDENEVRFHSPSIAEDPSENQVEDEEPVNKFRP
ncbi:MAG: hypothetical protein P4M12_10805 [Gammaproteobacteria bacterium]|nr:hypothetical protein [Gammaproteobacteria bacterium]